MNFLEEIDENYPVEEVEPFDLSKIETGLTKKAKEILDDLANNVIYVCDHIDDYESWILDKLMIDLLHGYEHREFRLAPLYFRFTHDKNEETKVTSFRMFIANAIIWYPQIMIAPQEISDDMVVPVEDSMKFVPNYIADYVNDRYIDRYFEQVEIHFLNECLSDMVFMFNMYGHRFRKILGVSMNTEVFMDTAKRIPEFNANMHYKLDPTKQPAEIEEEARRIGDRQWDIVKNDAQYTSLTAMISTNSLKKAQFNEFCGVVALKADTEGKTIPYPININWLTGEMNTIMISFINAISGRKASIINNEFMGSAGHTLILVAIMCIDAKLSKTVKDCNSPNPVPIHIKSKQHLQKLNGRYFRFPGSKNYQMLNMKTDENLIGDTLYFRSPATCCSEDGRICWVCYGKLAKLNSSLYSVGAYAAFRIMERLTQDLLSVKHSQQTKSSVITFPPEFYTFFVLSATDIILNPENMELDEYTLVIEVADIKTADGATVINFDNDKKKRRKKNETIDDTEDRDDEEDGFKLDYYTTKFYVVRNFYNKRNAEYIEISEKNKKELYMHRDFISRMKAVNTNEHGKCLTIDLNSIDYTEFIFMTETENAEVSKSLKRINSLIGNSKHEGCKTYEDAIQLMLDLLIESNNPGQSLQGEIILRQLIRDSVYIMRRPDFRRLIMPKDYKFMSMTVALKTNKSITTSLSTQYLKYQLVSMAETFMKTDTSDLDAPFRITLEELAYPIIKEY